MPVELEGRSVSVDLHVMPAEEMRPTIPRRVNTSRPNRPAESAGPSTTDTARQLERELEQVKAHLRDTVEQYEGSTEELKASNEELQAMNEELRSATEELETGREELQSINEELTTVNLELKGKVDELGERQQRPAEPDGATAIATVFLDRELCIMRYTPPAVQIFNLIRRHRPAARGPVESHRLSANARRRRAGRSSSLVPVEREVAGRRPLVPGPMLPYRTIEDQIAGVVFTFVDITERKHAEERCASPNSSSGRWSASVFAGVVHMALDGRITLTNRRFGEFTGFGDEELHSRRLQDVMHPEDRRREKELFDLLVRTGTPFELESLLAAQRWRRGLGESLGHRLA